jgi:ABC-2 type transport system ATP-binding protein
MTIEIECRELSKEYGSFRALDGITLQVQQGEILGFLGPNGAGKTTTIRLLMGMLIPTSGSAFIHGLDCHADRVEVKRYVGYLPDQPVFHDYLRGEEILRFVGEMQGLDHTTLDQRVPQLLETFGLSDAAFEFAVNYSTGMKRKLALACAQIHDPEVYILDEPTSGLDPVGSRDLQNWIRESAHTGKTIFLSTHLLDMAERLCTRVGIVDRGRLLALGPLDELKDRLCPGGTLEEIFFKVTQPD